MSARCRTLVVDGQPVLVRGSGKFTPTDQAMFAELVRAARRRLAREGMRFANRGPITCPCGRLRLSGRRFCGLHADTLAKRGRQRITRV